MKERKPQGLFAEMTRSGPRQAGILSSQEIRELIGNGKIRSSVEISDDQIQPASMDLRLGNVAYRVQASFLPGRSSALSTKIAELKIAEYDLSRRRLAARDRLASGSGPPRRGGSGGRPACGSGDSHQASTPRASEIFTAARR